MRRPEIELLWWEGCPSTDRALSELREALDELGLSDTDVRLRQISTDEAASAEQFSGSPTIRIDGVDVVPVPAGPDVGLSCRVYRRRDGRISPTPDPEDLREALATAVHAIRGGARMTLALGELAPAFELPDTAGERHAPSTGSPTVIVFTCNHCPYALAWHERLMGVGRDYGERGVQFLAINPNDSDRYPRDSLDAMRRRVEGEAWSMPYLRDETQAVARAYGAKTTPDVFVLDGEGAVRYRGAPDADYDDPGQNAAWLRDALDAVLAGEQPSRPETQPVGCSIKWK